MKPPLLLRSIELEAFAASKSWCSKVLEANREPMSLLEVASWSGTLEVSAESVMHVMQRTQHGEIRRNVLLHGGAWHDSHTLVLYPAVYQGLSWKLQLVVALTRTVLNA